MLRYFPRRAAVDFEQDIPCCAIPQLSINTYISLLFLWREVPLLFPCPLLLQYSSNSSGCNNVVTYLQELNKCKTELQYWRSRSPAVPPLCAECGASLRLSPALAQVGGFCVQAILKTYTIEDHLSLKVGFRKPLLLHMIHCT